MKKQLKLSGMILALSFLSCVSMTTSVYATKKAETTEAITTVTESKKETTSNNETKNDTGNDEEQGEWTKEKKEDVYTAYSFSEWNSLENFSFAENGSYAQAKIPDDFREKWEKTITASLNDNIRSGKYGKAEYKELMLCILYDIDYPRKIWGGDPLSTADFFEFNRIVGQKEILSISQCVQAYFNRLIDAENRYLNADENRYFSIYEPDEALGAVLQGIIYGDSYLDEYETYNLKEAKAFEKEHEDTLYIHQTGYDKIFWSTSSFAKSILEEYKGVAAGEHRIVDNSSN